MFLASLWDLLNCTLGIMQIKLLVKMLQDYCKKKKINFLNLIKSAKITCSSLKSICLCVMNISLVVIHTMLHCQWSLQLSVTSATSYVLFSWTLHILVFLLEMELSTGNRQTIAVWWQLTTNNESSLNICNIFPPICFAQCGIIILWIFLTVIG